MLRRHSALACAPRSGGSGPPGLRGPRGDLRRGRLFHGAPRNPPGGRASPLRSAAGARGVEAGHPAGAVRGAPVRGPVHAGPGALAGLQGRRQAGAGGLRGAPPRGLQQGRSPGGGAAGAHRALRARRRLREEPRGDPVVSLVEAPEAGVPLRPRVPLAGEAEERDRSLPRRAPAARIHPRGGPDHPRGLAGRRGQFGASTPGRARSASARGVSSSGPAVARRDPRGERRAGRPPAGRAGQHPEPPARQLPGPPRRSLPGKPGRPVRL